jgi:hypothetical protein
MQWNLEGLTVTGVYLGDFHVVGTVRLSRVKYGGGVCHHVDLAKPITVYGASRDTVILDHAQVTKVMQ